MGYNTTVLILNDSLDILEKHPQEFVDGIVRKMNTGGDIGVRGHVNPAHVMPTAHADVFRLYCTQGNAITELSMWSNETMRMATDEREYLQRHVLDLIDKAEHQLKDLKKAIKDASAS
jgi:methyl coenzyme M reductase subunit C-like uncharacterized protein (methanogenesis marker protein 7)